MSQVLLGITGSIAAYKTPELIRRFVKKGHAVQPILTEAGHQFVAPLALSTVAETACLTDYDFLGGRASHLAFDKTADILVVAPCTANHIAKFASGIADDALSTTFLSFTGPKLLVPAMHSEMLFTDAIASHLELLRSRGVFVLGPDTGDLACGDEGMGRMVDLDLIVNHVESVALGPLDLSGRRLLISAGGTREKMDTVRVISNLSSGKLGHELATMAAFFGAEVTLVTTQPLLSPHPDISLVSVESVDEMQAALAQVFPHCDALYMAAAVSDFTVDIADEKLRRSEVASIALKGTPDILAGLSVQRSAQTLVGFCLADDEVLLDVAREKLQSKGVDYIVANAASAIGQSRRSATILSAKDDVIDTLEDVSVPELARALLGLL